MTMKKFGIALFFCLILASAALAAPAVYIRNKPVNEAVVVKQGKIYLPLEVLKQRLEVNLAVEGSTVNFNGKALSQAPLLKNGVYYVSLEDAARAAGFEYQFSQTTNIIDVFKAQKAEVSGSSGQVISVSENKIPGTGKITVKTLQLGALEELKQANKGKILILDFWATWCPPCRKEIPDFIKLNNAYASKGVVIIGLSIDDQGLDYVQKFVDEPFGEGIKINYPIYVVDDAVSDKYQISGIPATYIYNRAGELAHKHVGLTTKQDFENEIEALLK
jgi:thiol-disulfide isomerase/thioredoxin